MSNNKLFGEIPTTLGHCTSLEIICMNMNLFQGSIPSSLSSLRGPQTFDLSHDNLSGPIPSYLESFSLKYLNISSDKLEGEVPTNRVFRNGSAVSVVGNNLLRGGVPELQLPKCNIKKAKKQRMSFVDELTISLLVVLAGVTLVSFFFCFLAKRKREVESSTSSCKESFLKVS